MDSVLSYDKVKDYTSYKNLDIIERKILLTKLQDRLLYDEKFYKEFIEWSNNKGLYDTETKDMQEMSKADNPVVERMLSEMRQRRENIQPKEDCTLQSKYKEKYRKQGVFPFTKGLSKIQSIMRSL